MLEFAGTADGIVVNLDIRASLNFLVPLCYSEPAFSQQRKAQFEQLMFWR